MSAAVTPVFLLPTLLAVPLPVAPYAVSLSAVAAVCLACLGAVAFGVRAVGRDAASTGSPVREPAGRS
ncbi:hypothetical protein [Nocardiopsis dassonvillei]|uniref:hypothetical protein n=1 Tax=Nocardiopsis dassonvillei TaxID=2014 RepID=UPI00362B10F5